MTFKVLALTLILTLFAVTFLAFANHKRVHAQACGPQVRCGGSDYYCGDLGTSSLPAVDTHQSGDWYIAEEDLNKKCGVKYCYPVGWFQCECGQPRSVRQCTSSEKGSL